MHSRCGPGAYTLFGRERNAKKNEKIIVKIKQAAANIICSSTWWIFQKNQPTKKKTKNRGKELEKLPRRTVVPGITYYIKDALDNHEQTEGGADWKRPRQRGTDASFTCVLLRSCRDVRRPRHLPNAKTAAISQPNLIDETTKKQESRISEIPTPGRYRTKGRSYRGTQLNNIFRNWIEIREKYGFGSHRGRTCLCSKFE